MPRVDGKFRLKDIFFEDDQHYAPASVRKRGTNHVYDGYYIDNQVWAYIKKQPNSPRPNRYISDRHKYLFEVKQKATILISVE